MALSANRIPCWAVLRSWVAFLPNFGQLAPSFLIGVSLSRFHGFHQTVFLKELLLSFIPSDWRTWVMAESKVMAASISDRTEFGIPTTILSRMSSSCSIHKLQFSASAYNAVMKASTGFPSSCILMLSLGHPCLVSLLFIPSLYSTFFLFEQFTYLLSSFHCIHMHGVQ